MTWNMMSFTNKLSVLAGETSIHELILMEDEEIVKMVKENRTFQECVDFINNRF